MSKRFARRLLCSAPLQRVWQLPGGTLISVFTLHRFAVPDLGVPGHDPAEVADTLAQLRRHRIPILKLQEVVDAVHVGRSLPRRAAVFTVDDGYFDFAEFGAPIFASFDCPVTVFLVTGFLDGTCWLWWDKIRYIMTNGSPRVAACLSSSGGRVTGAEDRIAWSAGVSAAMTRIPHAEIAGLTSFLAEQGEVVLPERPPEASRPMTWDAVRALQGGLVAFGPHTITHPILPNTETSVAAHEIHGSWNRLREMLTDPLPVFSYPNGDHGPREVGLVRAAGLVDAVSTVPTYLKADKGPQDPEVAFRIPRFPYPDQTEGLVLTVSGFRRIQLAVDPRAWVRSRAR